MKKYKNNPVIQIDDIYPSREDFKVDGTFNAGCVSYKGKIILILRVAESFVTINDDIIEIPINENGNIVKRIIKKSDENYDFSDSRIVINKNNQKTEFLTSISHLRIAQSVDGYNFEIGDKIELEYDELEQWGIEDPRVIKVEDKYFINYTAVSKRGACTSMISTYDFKSYKKEATIFTVENKDVCIFNEKINGLYYAYHRPVPKAFGDPDMWLASSPDLIHFGNHKYFLGVREGNFWDNGRIGGGAPPIKTSFGWLNIYHACNKENVYCLGAFLTPLDKPDVIIKRSINPLVKPDMDYEINGFFANVVFSCGTILEDDNLIIYYGAADDKVCRIDMSIEQIINSMEDIYVRNK